ncbi:metal-dependent hydrolase [Paenibacillus sp. N3/727]|uniref:metal-dependent hydrolase n=1 Tax=Paenibacillus sp. N3/727 TaxID=2925845 RepID=UPI001F52C04D|nr:metal-dependent hydrolase [Paenibacillus sp. N3/727]UNK17500.1 metal-dependent hydrolase [Paenibacillus sp. N3/727]
MMGRAHLVISTGVTLSVMGLAGIPVTLPAAAAAAVSSLLPDIDEPNSILVRTVIPTGLLRVLQLALVVGAVFIFYYSQDYAPWNLALAGLIAVVSFLPGRTLRHIVMFMIGLGLLQFGQAFSPWNTIAGCVLMISTLVSHRGLTHTAYAAAGWTMLLYFATKGTAGGESLWIAGGMSYALHLAADMLTNRGIRPLPPLKFRVKFKLMSTGSKWGNTVENMCIVLTLVLLWYVFIASK